MTDPKTGPTTDPEQPLLRVVKGDPTAEEVAALVAVVSALTAARAGGESRPRSEWSSPHRKLRSPLAPGWRSSSLPG